MKHFFGTYCGRDRERLRKKKETQLRQEMPLVDNHEDILNDLEKSGHFGPGKKKKKKKKKTSLFSHFYSPHFFFPKSISNFI